MFNCFVEIILKVEKPVGFAEGDAMNRKSFKYRIPGTNALKRVVRFGGFVADHEDLVTALLRLAGYASRVNFRSSAPVGEEGMYHQGDAHCQAVCRREKAAESIRMGQDRARP